MKRTILLSGGLAILLACAVMAAVPQLINFQGILRDGSGNPVANSSYMVLFTIYDAPTAGSAIWSQTYSVTTSSGLFTILLGSGPIPIADSTFNDSSRYLEIKVGADPPMTPRQRLSSVGYSYVSSQWTSADSNLFRQNGNVGIGTSAPFAKLHVEISGSGAPQEGVLTLASASDVNDAVGVYAGGSNSSTGRAFGIIGNGNTNSNIAYGGYFRGNSTSSVAYGVYGIGDDYGVYGDGYFGVYGTGPGYGGYFSSSNIGVWGSGTYRGVYGVNGTYGVYGQSIVSGGAAVFGDIGGNFGTWGGFFQGDVHVDRNLVVVGSVFKGGGGFKIDHPTDPANKYLYHSFVESPDMKNIYDGVVAMDAKGEAIVTLPDWFGTVNGNFRYQLTAIGAPGPNLYVAQEVSDNQFKIAGGTPGMKVSWQLTGIRQDAYARAHRIPVEEEKPAAERGKYLHPKELGLSETLGMNYEETQKLAAENKKMDERQATMKANRKQQEEQKAKMEQERLMQEQKVKENQPNK